MSCEAVSYGRLLLTRLGRNAVIRGRADTAVQSYYRSGLYDISGVWVPTCVSAAADGAMLALKALAPDKEDLPQNGALLLGERGRFLELSVKGAFSANGTCRLLQTKTGFLALNMAREVDWQDLAAWLEVDHPFAPGDWRRVERLVRHRVAAELVARGQEIGLAVAEDQLSPCPAQPFRIDRFQSAENKGMPVVVDLSALWAGPLAGSLLQMLGAKVVKVESAARPDGARQGHAGFYALLNAGKACVSYDFRSPEDIRHLKTLLSAADIVIDSARPRALAQLGLDRPAFMKARPGKVWVSLTAYGPARPAIGFGDDISVAAGLSQVRRQSGGGVGFVGDAIADPVAGLHGALAAWALWQAGGGAWVNVNMCALLRFAMGQMADVPPQTPVPERLYPLRRFPKQTPAALGADTSRLAEFLC